MLSWCTTLGAGGWLLMVALWATFVALAVWTITRLFPVVPARLRETSQASAVALSRESRRAAALHGAAQLGTGSRSDDRQAPGRSFIESSEPDSVRKE